MVLLTRSHFLLTARQFHVLPRDFYRFGFLVCFFFLYFLVLILVIFKVFLDDNLKKAMLYCKPGDKRERVPFINYFALCIRLVLSYLKYFLAHYS